MAITVNFNADSYGEKAWPAALKPMVGEIAGPASYATGGFTAEVAFDFEIDTAKIKGAWIGNDAGYSATFDANFEKIVAYVSGGTQVTATTDLSGVTFTILILVSDE